MVDILSVVFAKPEQRTKKAINILTERRVNARRALMDEICTIIFTTAQALQQFIIQFRSAETWRSQPQMQIGFTETKMSQTILQIEEHSDHMELNQYKSTNKTFGYQSNVKATKHTELQASLDQPIVSTRVSIADRCLIALSTLKAGRQEMDGNDFGAILAELCSEMNLQTKVQNEINESNKRGLDSISQGRGNENNDMLFNVGTKGKVAPRVDRKRLQIKDSDK